MRDAAPLGFPPSFILSSWNGGEIGIKNPLLKVTKHSSVSLSHSLMPLRSVFVALRHAPTSREELHDGVVLGPFT